MKFGYWFTKLFRSFFVKYGFSLWRYFISSTKSYKLSGRHFEGFSILRICLAHDSFCLCIKPPSLDLLCFFSRFDKSFVQFFLHCRKHYFPMPCWSWSPFLFLYQLFNFHPVSIYVKFIRSLIDILPIIIVTMNNFKFDLLKDLLDDSGAIFPLCWFDWDTACFLVDSNVADSNLLIWFLLHSPNRLKYIRKLKQIIHGIATLHNNYIMASCCLAKIQSRAKGHHIYNPGSSTPRRGVGG